MSSPGRGCEEALGWRSLKEVDERWPESCPHCEGLSVGLAFTRPDHAVISKLKFYFLKCYFL